MAIVSFGLFFWAQFLISVPSRYQTQPPVFDINEGREQCFAANSSWARLKQSKVKEIHDAFHLGGTDPKNILLQQNSDGDEFKSLWKPYLPRIGKHKANVLHEILVFHVDCLLGLKRTPPAAMLSLDPTPLTKSLSIVSKELYEERISKDVWDLWFNEGTVQGVTQKFVEDLHHIDWFGEKMIKILKKISFPFNAWDWAHYFIGGGSATIREYSQKDMLDFICGNWDRMHNQFTMFFPERQSYELVYLDHNHLKNTKENAFDLKYCKFWRDSIDNLLKVAYSEDGTLIMATSIRYSLKYAEPDFDYGVKYPPLLFMNYRVRKFLTHVESCVEKYGESYVFDE